MTRRCMSYGDLRRGAHTLYPDSISDSDGENPQPIKRSRSDQSLPQLAGSNEPSSGSGSCAACQHTYGLAQQQPCARLLTATYAPQSSRAQRAPSLPVVLSDVGSSTNSLLSLDSLEAAARSASQQHLTLLPMQAGIGHLESAAAAAARDAGGNAAAGDAFGAASKRQLAGDGSPPAMVSREHSSSSGVFCSLNPVSSAASLTQAQLWARGYDLPRATSDASFSSGDYSAALQQLGLPPAAYSPPPLLPPGLPVPPSALGADARTAATAAEALHGVEDALGLGSSTAGSFKPGLSIQQQKQASFVGPQQPASSAATGVLVTPARGSSSWGMRPVNSKDSLHSSDSIASVEAGERLAGVRFGQTGVRTCHNASPSQLKQSSSAANSQLPPLSPPNAGAGSMHAAALAGKHATGSGPAVAGSSGRPQAAAGSGRPPIPGGFSSPANAVAASWAGSSVASPGMVSEGSEAASTAAGASPAIELQSMGSMLGGDGQWLFGELSTGAIGALSPAGLLLRQPFEPEDQQQQGQLQQQREQQQQQQGQQEAATVALAAPVPVSSALPAISSSTAPSCSLPLVPAAGGAFGFGFAGAPAGAAAAAAAAAAKLCLFDSGFASAAGAPQQGQPTQPMQQANGSGPQPADAAAAPGLALPLPAGNNISAFSRSSWSSGSSRGVSASLPRISPNRSSLCGVPGADGVMRLGDPRQQQQQPYRPSQHDASQWSFNRRGVSLDCARTSLSSRRRGSLDLNMPWRKTLDAAIAKAAADTGMANPVDSPNSSGGGMGADADTAVEMAAGEAEATFGSGALGSAWPRQPGTPQLDLLMPLPEADDESLPSPCGCGPGSIGPGSIGSGGRASFDAELSSHPGSTRSARSSSSGGSVAADHDLPGSTNIGGYIGGSDSLGLARHSLDSPRKAAAAAAAAATQQQQQHDSYGLEFDGAVQMEAVATGATPLKVPQQQQQQKQGMASAFAAHSHAAEQQQRLAQEQCVKVGVAAAADMSSHEEQESHEEQDTSSSDDGEEDAMQLSGDSQQGEPRLAGKRSSPQAWHKANGTAAAGAGAAAAGASAFMSAPVSALGLDGPGLAIDLQSYPSASSISSRGSTGFCNRGGTGNGTSRDLELFVRLNRARQTLDFAKRQAQAFSELDRAELSVWEAFDLLGGLREYEAGLMHAAAGSGGGSAQDDSQLTPDMSLKEHAVQVAELCRLSFPDKPWMALVGLLHGFGKLLAHPLWGSQPQWAVAGESYPVGCKFAPQVGASEFFSANPDRRRRAYSTTLGVYQEGCGLRNVYMSWGAAEYLYMLLVLNQTQLPEEALFMIRYQRCYALTRAGGAYRQLMSAEDKQLLPLLLAFQSILTYKRTPLPPGALQGQAFYEYYSGLINTYLGEEALFW